MSVGVKDTLSNPLLLSCSFRNAARSQPSHWNVSSCWNWIGKKRQNSFPLFVWSFCSWIRCGVYFCQYNVDKSVGFSSLLRSVPAGKTQANHPDSECGAQICRGCTRASLHVPRRGRQVLAVGHNQGRVGASPFPAGQGWAEPSSRVLGCCREGAWLPDVALTWEMHLNGVTSRLWLRKHGSVHTWSLLLSSNLRAPAFGPIVGRYRKSLQLYCWHTLSSGKASLTLILGLSPIFLGMNSFWNLLVFVVFKSSQLQLLLLLLSI